MSTTVMTRGLDDGESGCVSSIETIDLWKDPCVNHSPNQKYRNVSFGWNRGGEETRNPTKIGSTWYLQEYKNKVPHT